MSTTKATYILPTTGDRGPLVVHSVGSILQQSLPDLEVFIIGDGVDDQSRAIILELCAQDSRVVFFDHEKHPRRGEPYRHDALMQHAKGEIVCYLCDRDLLLPNHLELMWKHTRKYNFVVLNFLRIAADHKFRYGNDKHRCGPLGDDYLPDDADDPRIKLSLVGHTLAFYKELPIGWSTTPDDRFTDRYMWSKFFSHPSCKPYVDPTPAILYFNRGNHPGWSSERRLADIENWVPVIKNADSTKELLHLAKCQLINKQIALTIKVKQLEKALSDLEKR